MLIIIVNLVLADTIFLIYFINIFLIYCFICYIQTSYQKILQEFILLYFYYKITGSINM